MVAMVATPKKKQMAMKQRQQKMIYEEKDGSNHCSSDITGVNFENDDNNNDDDEDEGLDGD